MTSTATATVVKMMESLPETVQDQVVEYLRVYVAELHDELQWESLFEQTEQQLVAAARRARKEIAEGYAEPMDYDRL